MTIAWVVGRGGVFGSALEIALTQARTVLFVPSAQFAWRGGEALLSQIEDSARAFAEAAANADRWEIYWAAGVGTMSSAEAELVPETRALEVLLDAVGRSGLVRTDCGAFALASSAGALYAGSSDPLISEATDVAPTTPYAHAKLAQEKRVERFAVDSGVRTLIGRISTLYGVGQSSGKADGLLTHISRCMVRNRAVQIFVPLDTIRDYIAADDAAAMLIDALGATESGRVRMKIIASEHPATIGEIVSMFKRIARRPPRIITSATPSTSIYARRIQFRSIVSPHAKGRQTSLLVGVSQVMAAERARYVAPSEVPLAKTGSWLASK